MSTFLAILSALIGAGASLMMFVLLIAGSPNSSPEQLSHIKLLMLSVAVIALACAVGAVWAIATSRPWIGAGIGAAPAVYVVGLFIVLMMTQ